VLVSNE